MDIQKEEEGDEINQIKEDKSEREGEKKEASGPK